MEVIISWCVIFILLGTFFGYASKVLEAAREVALKWELHNLRLSYQLYRALNGKPPEKLAELYGFDYHVSIDRFDKTGELLDPFGRPYLYNPARGDIHTSSVKYLKW